ncbi:MAG TPA: hypothetical protein DD435_15750 [Cyanobacteria bacterium UBA8530]|nr:hypothetical protein [Cyanobacteria bacterium UBA8530]
MKKQLTWFFLASVLTGCANSAPGTPDLSSDPAWQPPGAVREELVIKPQAPSVRQNQIIVALKPGVKTLKVQSVDERVIQSLSLTSHYQVVSLPAGMSIEEGKALYSKNPGVSYVAENRIYHTNTVLNDPLLDQEWAFRKNRINMEPVWGRSIDASGIVVAVLDSGIDFNHPEFAGRVMRGWNFADNSSDVMDRVGHGTHVAGIIGASGNNGQGISGVANCKLMAVKVLNDRGEGTTDAVAAGIKYAADYGAKVINMSLGSSDTRIDPVIHEALGYARDRGCLVLAAAGNDSAAVGCPANDPQAMAVSSTSNFLLFEYFSWFSNRGEQVVVAAPGGSILSTLPLGSNLMGATSYGKLSGTSMATPFVAGEAALLFALHSDWTPDQVRQRIIDSADRKKGGRNVFYGWGRINIGKAVS